VDGREEVERKKQCTRGLWKRRNQTSESQVLDNVGRGLVAGTEVDEVLRRWNERRNKRCDRGRNKVKVKGVGVFVSRARY
jgi:hypothetical protein